ncbi:uncharacterized protein K02A2.6-like [Liolophura sinensis]|uniref:uncharacterized protein K02A2.6-like n=1 Tax=Liolophura sinensis TaxID=3198878 RepID=UPI0031584B52
MDLFEWKKNSYLVVVGYYSRFIEIAYLTSTTSVRVIEHLKSIFSRHGIPELVASDNGPQFSSGDFAKFGDKYGFRHTISSPHYRLGNNEAERAVETDKGLLNKADDPYLAMLSYHSTPLQNGFTPTELMGRKLRTKVPVLPSTLVPDWHGKNVESADQKQKERQKRNFDNLHKSKPLPK